MTTITKKQVVEHVEAFLNENPDIGTYTDIVNRDGDEQAREGLLQIHGGAATCYYRTVDRTKPLCIVGQVFDRLGLTITADQEKSAAYEVIVASDAEFTHDAQEFLCVVQNRQDKGGYLREALANFR